MIGLEEIKQAGEKLAGVANRTPVFTSRTLDGICGAKVFFKCENFQRGGAFKFRGAYNTVSGLSPSERSRGVVTHSSGNHAQALALCARILGVRAKIVMPEGSSAVKVEAVRSYGAEVVFCANTQQARESKAREIVDNEGLTLVHPYNDERIMAGQGTASLELMEEAGPLDMILAPVGGGGLLSGTAAAAAGIDGLIRVVGAEPAGADDAFRSLRAGSLVEDHHPDTIADGLRVRLGERPWEVIRRLVHDIITVGEDEIVGGMRFLMQRMKLVVEPSSAVPVAILLRGDRWEGKKPRRVGVIVSGGNVDLKRFFDQYGDN